MVAFLEFVYIAFAVLMMAIGIIAILAAVTAYICYKHRDGDEEKTD